MGPSLIFDKSFLQCLSIDEAAMLDQLYQCVVTPIFFVETLADLGKPENARRPPEQIVGGLAERTPVCASAMNESHWNLLIDSLSGQTMPLDYRPMVPGGIPVRVEGKAGVVFEKSPETEAFERWQQYLFTDVERFAANRWRKALGQVKLSEVAEGFRAQLRKEERPKSLEATKQLARRVITAGGVNFHAFRLVLDVFGVPQRLSGRLILNWKRSGRKPLQEYAPYAAHCLEVMLFFYLGMANGLISDQRPSNLVDMAYLFYLPFARLFASSDKLHRRVVPLFLSEAQAFVWGPDLKDDLGRTDTYFSNLPEEERAKGLFLLAKSPPKEAELISEHWDRFATGWRTRMPISGGAVPPALGEDVVARSNAFIAAAAARNIAQPSASEPDHLVIQRFIPRQRGKWRMFSKEIEEAEEQRQAEERGHQTTTDGN